MDAARNRTTASQPVPVRERDIAGSRYPRDVVSLESRDRWDMAVLCVTGGLYPLLQNPLDLVIPQEAARLFRSELPLGPEPEVRELLAGVREAGGMMEWFALEAAG